MSKFEIFTQFRKFFFGICTLGACNCRSIGAKDLKIGRHYLKLNVYMCAKFQLFTIISSYFFTCAHTLFRKFGTLGAYNFRSNQARNSKIDNCHQNTNQNVCAKFQVSTTISSYFFTCAHTIF